MGRSGRHRQQQAEAEQCSKDGGAYHWCSSYLLTGMNRSSACRASLWKTLSRVPSGNINPHSSSHPPVAAARSVCQIGSCRLTSPQACLGRSRSARWLPGTLCHFEGAQRPRNLRSLSYTTFRLGMTCYSVFANAKNCISLTPGWVPI